MAASSTRLFVLIARQAPKAVVFRRGPSKQVACIGWDLRRDRFELGQWLKGRIYERRCDLSPSGELLAYFAANWKPGIMTWTAVSRAPYLKAIMLWPKGDTWGGGGLFEGERQLALNHGEQQFVLAPGEKLLRGFRVVPLGSFSGRGEDGPIDAQRRMRDGWSMARAPSWKAYVSNGPVAFPVEAGEEQVLVKPQPLAAKAARKPRAPVLLQELLLGVGERDGTWYMTEHRLARSDRDETASLGRTDWADWDHQGDLLFARTGRLFRLAAKDARDLQLDRARELIDLRPMRFEAKRAPYTR